MNFQRIKEGPGVWDFNIAHADGEGMLHSLRTATFTMEKGEELYVIPTTSTRVSRG